MNNRILEEKMFARDYLQQKLLAKANNISRADEQVELEHSYLQKKLKSFYLIQ